MLGDNLAGLRKKNRLSQQQLAERLNISPQIINLWETDQSVPDANQILLLSEALQISTDALLKGLDAVDPAISVRSVVCFIASTVFLMMVWISGFVLFIACSCAGLFSDFISIASMLLVLVSAVLFVISVFLERRRIRRLK